MVLSIEQCVSTFAYVIYEEAFKITVLRLQTFEISLKLLKEKSHWIFERLNFSNPKIKYAAIK